MSKIEQMIAEFCPNGVEYKELWELTAWDRKFNGLEREKQKKVINYPYILANRFKELEQPIGSVRLLSTGNYIAWTSEELAGENLCDGEIVAIPGGGSKCKIL
jgi:type I restriction enzyme S subunit